VQQSSDSSLDMADRFSRDFEGFQMRRSDFHKNFEIEILGPYVVNMENGFCFVLDYEVSSTRKVMMTFGTEHHAYKF
jgi:hypothetical protein